MKLIKMELDITLLSKKTAAFLLFLTYFDSFLYSKNFIYSF